METREEKAMAWAKMFTVSPNVAYESYMTGYEQAEKDMREYAASIPNFEPQSHQLTKREQIAAMCLQGLLASGKNILHVEDSIKIADELIKQLNQTTK